MTRDELPADVRDSGLDPERVERVRAALADRDWHAVTLAELAEAAGLSRMTLHRRGIGKDEVLRQLGALMVQDHREAIYPALVADGDGRQRLRIALEGLCAVNERYLGISDALSAIQLAEVFHEPGEGAVLTRATFTDGMRRILADGMADGSLREAELDDTATLLFNAVGWTYRHMRTGHRWPAERAREAVVELLLHGMLRDDGPSRSDA
jgi:AcrR family transcriptional regulator